VELSSIALESTVRVPPPPTKMPPPDVNRPYGGAAEALFPTTRELSSVSVAFASSTMPPLFDCTADAWLSLTVVESSVIVPQLSIPAGSPKDADKAPHRGRPL